MYSINIDYIFNTVYNILLWIRYVWVFVIWRQTPEAYLAHVDGREWDGLRDRGWIDEMIAKRDAENSIQEKGFFEFLAEKIGVKLPDRDGDGIPDVHDNLPYNSENLSAAEMKERFYSHYDFWDHLRDFFGFGPADADKDGLPDAYETHVGTQARDPDTDKDGVYDGNEISRGLNPLLPDTDGDGIIDGRDGFPLDPLRASRGDDSDHDGISDADENAMGLNPLAIDTDDDGIPDGADIYPLDAHNKSVDVSLGDYTRNLDGLHLAIQNPILQFVRDIFSIISLIGLVFLAITFMRFLREFWKAQMHYEHHFGHGAHGGHAVHTSGGHSVKHEVKEGAHTPHVEAHESHVIEGLAVAEGLPFEIEKPTAEDFEKHPKWAIVEGYMSSDSEALWRIGVLEADMILRDTLLSKGYAGSDVGELLQTAHFSTINLAWDAHKVRNRIAHDGSDYLLTDREARRVFAMYEAVFKELKVI